MEYNHREIEKRWQNYWRENSTYKTREIPGKKNSMCSICSPTLRAPDCMWDTH